MSKTAVLTIYVDQVKGNDSNNGTKSAPFKSLQKAIDIIPEFVNADIHILGDYILRSNVSIFRKTNVTLILHGTLTTTEYTPPLFTDHTGIYAINVVNSSVHVVIDSDINGKIVVPPKLSPKKVGPHHYSIFNAVNFSKFAVFKFDLNVKQNDYNPIIVNSGFGLVSVGKGFSGRTYLNVEIIGRYPGKNRSIIVNSNSTLVSFNNATGNFHYNYTGGLINETNTPIPVSSCINKRINSDNKFPCYVTSSIVFNN